MSFVWLFSVVEESFLSFYGIVKSCWCLADILYYEHQDMISWKSFLSHSKLDSTSEWHNTLQSQFLWYNLKLLQYSNLLWHGFCAWTCLLWTVTCFCWLLVFWYIHGAAAIVQAIMIRQCHWFEKLLRKFLASVQAPWPCLTSLMLFLVTAWCAFWAWYHAFMSASCNKIERSWSCLIEFTIKFGNGVIRFRCLFCISWILTCLWNINRYSLDIWIMFWVGGLVHYC